MVAEGKKPAVKRRPPRHNAPTPTLPPAEQPMMRRRLALLGLRLPEVKTPAFQYVPVVSYNGIAYVSGQLPWVDGALKQVGKVEAEVSIEQAREAARLCTLHALAWLNQSLPGGLDDVERALKVTGFVASSPEFHQQPQVIDAASEILVRIFGQAGHHARSAIGVAELPMNTPVEIEFTFALKRRPTTGGHQRRPGIPVIEKRS